MTLLDICESHVFHFMWALFWLGLLKTFMQDILHYHAMTAVLYAAGVVVGQELLELLVALTASEEPTMYLLTQTAFALLACDRFIAFSWPKEDYKGYQ